MSAIILLDANDALCCEILTVEYACQIDGSNLDDEDNWSANKVFDSVDAADIWLQKNAQMGWCTRIIEVDE